MIYIVIIKGFIPHLLVRWGVPTSTKYSLSTVEKPHLLIDNVRLVDGHELRHKSLQVYDLLASQMQSMLIEGCPPEHVGPQTTVQILHEFSRQRLRQPRKHTQRHGTSSSQQRDVRADTQGLEGTSGGS